MLALRSLTFMFVLLGSLCQAQVQSDATIIFTGPDQLDRQLKGLPDSIEPDAVLSTATEQAGIYRSSQATGTNSWSVDLPALSTDPIAGTHLMVFAPEPSTGDVTLLLNGSGPYPVITGPDSSFDASNVPAGTPLSLVFDGTSFHVLNGSVYARKPCAEGTVAVNEEFCIEPVEHAETDFFTAILNCAANGMRLCNWTEFIVACNKATELSIPGMLGNWEWNDDAVNENGTARIAGSTGCGVTGTALVSGSIDRGYHCCYTR
jgi:hypothetical protein